MPELLQHAIVTTAALGAAWLVLRRLFAAALPDSASHKCSSCPVAQRLGPQAPAPAEEPRQAPAHPLVLVKHGRR